jgi:hypothetical protein
LVATGTDVDEAKRLLTPDDDQSVLKAVKLMRAIRALIGKCLPDEKAGFQHVLTALHVERPVGEIRGERGVGGLPLAAAVASRPAGLIGKS